VDQYERYFVARTSSADVDPREADSYIVGHRWWSLEEIQASSEDFAPRRLGQLLPPLLRAEYPRPLLIAASDRDVPERGPMSDAVRQFYDRCSVPVGAFTVFGRVRLVPVSLCRMDYDSEGCRDPQPSHRPAHAIRSDRT
jgi:hypothetical protein